MGHEYGRAHCKCHQKVDVFIGEGAPPCVPAALATGGMTQLL